MNGRAVFGCPRRDKSSVRPADDIGRRDPYKSVQKDGSEGVGQAWFNMLYQVLLGEERGPRFGSFVARHYDAREGRNPRTAEPIHVKAKRLPFFKAGKELKQRVDAGKGPLRVDDERDGEPGSDAAE